MPLYAKLTSRKSSFGRGLRPPEMRRGGSLGVGEFVGVDQEVAVVHLGPGPVGLRLGPEGVASGKARQVRVGDGDVLSRVVLLQELLADEVDDVVLLARGEPHLRRHEAEAARQRLVERVRVGAVPEGLLPEPPGVGDGARLLGSPWQL